jgi:hypothetical protein
MELVKGSQHQRWCDKQPSGTPSGNRKGVSSWNAGLSGDPRLKHTAAAKQVMSEIALARPKGWNAGVDERIAATVNQKVADGTWHTSLAKRMHHQYNGESFHGSWEVAYAKFLDSVGTPWHRNTTTFSYEFGGKTRRYTPDFYLPIEDVYVEIKGYKTEKDAAKWEQFPETLVVLMKEELEDMNVI